MNDIDARRIADALESIADSLTKIATPAHIVEPPVIHRAEFRIGPNAFPCTRRGIVEAVEHLTGIPGLDVKPITNGAQVARARHVCMNLMRELLDLSLSEVGRHMHVDHTSVIYAVRRHEEYWNLRTSETVVDYGHAMAYRSLYEQAKKLVAPRPVAV